jgi:hypothetical protein
MNVATRSMAPGAASLPAELKAGRAGVAVNGRTRLLLSQHGGTVEAEPQPMRSTAGFGDILKARFVVPQNPVVVRNSTGASGVGRLAYIARLQGLGVVSGLGQDPCDPTDPAYDPATCADVGGTPVVMSDPIPLTLPVGNAPAPVESTLPSQLSPSIVGQSTDSFGNLSLTTSTGNVLTYPPGSSVTGSGSNLTVAVPSLGIPAGVVQVPQGYSGPAVVQGNAATPQAPAGYQWAQVTNAAGQTLAKVLAVAQGGAAVTLANGTQLVYGSAASAATAGVASALGTSSLSGILPLLLIGGVVLLLMGRK